MRSGGPGSEAKATTRSTRRRYRRRTSRSACRRSGSAAVSAPDRPAPGSCSAATSSASSSSRRSSQETGSRSWKCSSSAGSGSPSAKRVSGCPRRPAHSSRYRSHPASSPTGTVETARPVPLLGDAPAGAEGSSARRASRSPRNRSASRGSPNRSKGRVVGAWDRLGVMRRSARSGSTTNTTFPKRGTPSPSPKQTASRLGETPPNPPQDPPGSRRPGRRPPRRATGHVVQARACRTSPGPPTAAEPPPASSAPRCTSRCCRTDGRGPRCPACPSPLPPPRPRDGHSERKDAAHGTPAPPGPGRSHTATRHGPRPVPPCTSPGARSPACAAPAAGSAAASRSSSASPSHRASSSTSNSHRPGLPPETSTTWCRAARIGPVCCSVPGGRSFTGCSALVEAIEYR